MILMTGGETTAYIARRVRITLWRWEEAKEIYKEREFFSDDERDAEIRKIEIVQAHRAIGRR